jgi:DNA-binding Xre family transcriptional regulator
MIEEKRRAERRRQVAAIKRFGSAPNSRGFPLPGLWACRAAAGLTQRDLAERVGTSQGTVHDLECLMRGAYPKTIKKLCTALEVDPADLLCVETTEDE